MLQFHQFEHDRLSEREVFIAWLIFRGYSLAEICSKTGAAKRIIVAHIRNMQNKPEASEFSRFIRKFR